MTRAERIEAAAKALVERWDKGLRWEIIDEHIEALRAALAPTAGVGNLRPPTEVGK
jgi:hypothetical protein